jgi:hypothetical protein
VSLDVGTITLPNVASDGDPLGPALYPPQARVTGGGPGETPTGSHPGASSHTLAVKTQDADAHMSAQRLPELTRPCELAPGSEPM